MNKIITITLTIFFLISCDNPKSNQQKADNEINKSIRQEKACYQFNDGKDSIEMTIEIDNNHAKGVLTFNYYEKDSNNGIFSGTLNGDTLWANYTFISEGIESKREIAFLRQKDSWIEGYGEIMENNKGFIFKNHDDIKFDNSFILEKVECTH